MMKLLVLINILIIFSITQTNLFAYNNTSKKINKEIANPILIDDQLIEIFMQEIREIDLLKENNFEIISLKISPKNNLIYEKNFEIEKANKPIITNNGYIYIIFNINSEKKRRLRTVKIEAKIEITNDGYCISNHIDKDQVITENDIIPCKINISETKDHLVDVNQIIGMIAKHSLKPNTIITSNILKEPILIKRGDLVDVIYNKEPIKIIFKAEALQNGTKNSYIKVRNLNTKKDMVVKVMDKSTTILE